MRDKLSDDAPDLRACAGAAMWVVKAIRQAEDGCVQLIERKTEACGGHPVNRELKIAQRFTENPDKICFNEAPNAARFN